MINLTSILHSMLGLYYQAKIGNWILIFLCSHNFLMKDGIIRYIMEFKFISYQVYVFTIRSRTLIPSLPLSQTFLSYQLCKFIVVTPFLFQPRGAFFPFTNNFSPDD